jgi:transposase
VRVRPVVGVDETRLRLVRDKAGKTKNGFVWTFGARDDEGELDVAYVVTEDRSGSTSKTLLDGTTGVLLVDGYSGYNLVDEVSTRRRVACHAHLRRYFYEALPTAPVAQETLLRWCREQVAASTTEVVPAAVRVVQPPEATRSGSC